MTRATATVRGASLVELLVATVLLSMIALGLTSTLLAAQRARAISERRMQATLLAAEGIEQLRAGHALGPVRLAGFERSAAVAPWANHNGLVRIDVTITWNDGQDRQYQLSAVAPR